MTIRLRALHHRHLNNDHVVFMDLIGSACADGQMDHPIDCRAPLFYLFLFYSPALLVTVQGRLLRWLFGTNHLALQVNNSNVRILKFVSNEIFTAQTPINQHPLCRIGRTSEGNPFDSPLPLSLSLPPI